MRDRAGAKTPMASIERERAFRDARRYQNLQTLKRLGFFLAGVIAIYLSAKHAAVRHWLAEFLSRPLPWWGMLLIAFPGLFPLFFFPWLAVFKLKERHERLEAWRFALYWALFMAFCIYMVWSGRWPPDCNTSDCY